MNQNIIKNLNILAKYYKTIGDPWRQQAYQRAIISIKSYPKEIVDIKQVKGLKGIGKTMQTKIKEYLDTGHIRKVDEIQSIIEKESKKNTQETTIDTFKNIWGIGPAKATELWKAGFRSLEDLRKNPKLLTSQQKVGLKYYNDLLQP